MSMETMTTQDLDIVLVDKAPELFSSKVSEETVKTLKFTTTLYSAEATFLNGAFQKLEMEFDNDHFLEVIGEDDLEFLTKVICELNTHRLAS